MLDLEVERATNNLCCFPCYVREEFFLKNGNEPSAENMATIKLVRNPFHPVSKLLKIMKRRFFAFCTWRGEKCVFWGELLHPSLAHIILQIRELSFFLAEESSLFKYSIAMQEQSTCSSSQQCCFKFQTDCVPS